MTVLSESIVYVATDAGRVVLVIVIIAFIAAFVLAVNLAIKPMIVAIACAVILLVLLVCQLREPYRRLKVTISDDYPAMSLYENYIVLDRDGAIWTIQEREPMAKEVSE